MIEGQYILHLHCDMPNLKHTQDEFPYRFTGVTDGECRRDARLKGWKLNTKTGIAICPKCRPRRGVQKWRNPQ